MTEHLFIVVKVKDPSATENSIFEFQGVFDNEEQAVAACLNVNYGIGPALLNERIGDGTEPWIGFYLPHMMPNLPK